MDSDTLHLQYLIGARFQTTFFQTIWTFWLNPPVSAVLSETISFVPPVSWNLNCPFILSSCLSGLNNSDDVGMLAIISLNYK